MHTAAKKWGFFESQRWWEVIDSLGIPSSGLRDRFVAEGVDPARLAR